MILVGYASDLFYLFAATTLSSYLYAEDHCPAKNDDHQDNSFLEKEASLFPISSGIQYFRYSL